MARRIYGRMQDSRAAHSGEGDSRLALSTLAGERQGVWIDVGCIHPRRRESVLERKGEGAGQLCAVWRDPDFDAEQRAFYYVRVLQVPTCRWSTYDAEKLGIEIPAHLPRMLQERAITSPVWYAPQPI